VTTTATLRPDAASQSGPGRTAPPQGWTVPPPLLTRWRLGGTAWGAGFGLAPSLLTGALAVHGTLDPPTWLIVADVIGPLVGAAFGLLSFVVATRTLRKYVVDCTMALGAVDAGRMAMLEVLPLEPDRTVEVSIVRVPEGFKASVSRTHR
jgi:hypothetical protein